MTHDSNTTLATRQVKEVYAVSRLVREVRGLLEGSFPLIWVEGEISNLVMAASGHIYFTLKDEVAQVRCAMFRNRNRQLRFTPKNGMQILLRVRVTLYEGRGEFQLIIEHMEELGSGALQRAYDALKHRLGDEGLFDQAHKQNLPSLPASIGIISSPDGAAVHDILTVLNRRFPAAKVIVYPVLVQGTDSAEQLKKAVLLADRRQECEVIIISRGGGSIEDLWSFNDEKLARAIFACTIPIISAVGHEIDFTIADFVADVRAPTPSAAAEIAVPDGKELLSKVKSHARRLHLLMSHLLQTQQDKISHLQQRLPSPQIVIRQQMQTIDGLNQQLSRNWQQIVSQKQHNLAYWSLRLKHPQQQITAKKHQLQTLYGQLQQNYTQVIGQKHSQFESLQMRLQVNSPEHNIQIGQQRVQQNKQALVRAIDKILNTHQAHLSLQIGGLSALSPLRTLERGYSITTDEKSTNVLTDIDGLKIDQKINIQLQTGCIQCKITGVSDDEIN